MLWGLVVAVRIPRDLLLQVVQENAIPISPIPMVQQQALPIQMKAPRAPITLLAQSAFHPLRLLLLLFPLLYPDHLAIPFLFHELLVNLSLFL